MAGAAAERAYSQAATELYACLPASRAKPDAGDDAAAYERLTATPGIELPTGCVLLVPGDESSEDAAVQAFLAGLCAEWLAVATRAMADARVQQVLCDLTSSPRWSAAGAFSAGDAPYCDERSALCQAILDGMGRRGVDLQVFVHSSCPRSVPFVSALQRCAGSPDSGPLLPFWLEVSSRYGDRSDQGRLKRPLTKAVFEDKTLAIEAAASGNLVALKSLDSDGYDVRKKVGGGCCGGGKQAISIAQKNGHQECVVWIDELKLYPPVIKFRD